MNRNHLYYIVLLLMVSSCGNIFQKHSNNVIEHPNTENLNKYVGKIVTFKGKTVNAKLGALLIIENGQQIWMNDFLSWPSEYYSGNDTSRTIKVEGTLIKKNDLPVFITKENDTIIQYGIPVPEGTNLRKAKRRYLLKNIRCEIIEN